MAERVPVKVDADLSCYVAVGASQALLFVGKEVLCHQDTQI
jgi:hypothetical protein